MAMISPLKAIGSSLIILIIAMSCSVPQAPNKVPQTNIKIQNLVTAKTYEFQAERVTIMDPTVREVMNSMRSRPMEMLDYGYFLRVEPEKITSALPYFGRAYTPRFGGTSQENGINFESKEFELKEVNSKNKSRIYSIVPKDVRYATSMLLEIFPNGRAMLNVSSSDRQMISFDGRITAIEAKTKK